MIKLVSWNVNGLRACLQKGLLGFVRETGADAYCFQETKIAAEDLEKVSPLFPAGYHLYSCAAQKKGYSGLLTLSRQPAIAEILGIGVPEIDAEARVLTLEFDAYYLLNIYFPNAQRELARLDFKVSFIQRLLEFCQGLGDKPMVLCGDFNVAHQPIDLRNPRQNENNAGYSLPEREAFAHLLSAGFVDAFRCFVSEGGHYTWWSYRMNARAKDIGWRLDYFLVSAALRPALHGCAILKEVMGSDHCPVVLEMEI